MIEFAGDAVDRLEGWAGDMILTETLESMEVRNQVKAEVPKPTTSAEKPRARRSLFSKTVKFAAKKACSLYAVMEGGLASAEAFYEVN